MSVDLAVVELDPLRLDPFYRAPLAHRHPAHVCRILRRAIRRARRLGVPDAATAIAILRDLDPLMCAAERYIPGWWRMDGLEPLLLECARKCGYPPRGANHTYGTYNPPGERTRLFTGTDEERALYRGLAMGESRLDELLDALAVCAEHRLGSVECAGATAALRLTWQPMIDAAKLMRRARVAPVMAEQIAPWVSNIFRIDGRDFRGPTAAQLPVVDVDTGLWGADADDPVYQAYRAFYSAEQPPHRRARMAAMLDATGGRSLITRFSDEIGRVTPAERSAALAALSGIETLLTRMIGFRESHLRFALPSLPQRAHGEESWGSGSFDPEMMERLRVHTYDARDRARELAAKL